MLALKKQYKSFSLGDFKNISKDENAFIYERKYIDETITVICNFDKNNHIDGINGQVILSNLNRTEASGHFAPYECAVVLNML